MIQGVYKFRTDIRRTKREQHRADQRIFDMQINRICRLILFVKYLFPTQYDVGVDNNNYIPVSYIQVKHIIKKQVNESN